MMLTYKGIWDFDTPPIHNFFKLDCVCCEGSIWVKRKSNDCGLSVMHTYDFFKLVSHTNGRNSLIRLNAVVFVQSNTSVYCSRVNSNERPSFRRRILVYLDQMSHKLNRRLIHRSRCPKIELGHSGIEKENGQDLNLSRKRNSE
jgi:hypothetical protein